MGLQQDMVGVEQPFRGSLQRIFDGQAIHGRVGQADLQDSSQSFRLAVADQSDLHS
jgi:hypothetical protein